VPTHWESLIEIAQAEVTRTLKSLPRQLRDRARALPVTFEPQPNAALVAERIEPDTLGLFVGGELPEADHVELPGQIILFLENIWEMVEGDEEFFREEVRTTLLHELGHYLGLDEDDLEDRGLE